MDHNTPSPLSSSEQEDNPPPAVRQTFNTISTSAKIAQDVLRSAGLDWLLASNETTPQKFISDLAGHIPGNYLVG